MKSIYQLMDMHGQVSLITGGAGNLGQCMAETLAELGSDLFIVDLEHKQTSKIAKSLSERFTVKVETLSCDLEQQTELEQIPNIVKEKFGRLDVLINNAAFVGSSGLEGWATDFNNQSPETWRRALEVNLTAPFTLSQGCRELLDASPNSSIINIASIYGIYGPDLSLYADTNMNNPAAYSASKGGLIQLTRWLATVLSPSIRVNAISPGGIARGQPEAFTNKYVSRTPLNRMAHEEDFKGAIAYLSSAMSQYVTGQNLIVDGGWGAW